MKSKTLRGMRTAAEWKSVAKATRRRRRILQTGFFHVIGKQPLQFKSNVCDFF